MRPRHATDRLARGALAALGLLASGCRSQPGVEELPRRVDLLAQSDWAELRSGAANLELLFSRPLLLHEGLDRDRASFQVAPRARAAILQVPLSDARDRELTFVARSQGTEGTRQVLISWNGRAIGTVDLSPADSRHNLLLPAAAQRPGPNHLAFEPQGSQDRRHVGVSGLEIAEREAPRPLAIPAPNQDGFWLPAGSSLAFSLREEPPASLRLAARAPGAAARLAASLGDGRTVLDLTPAAGASGEATRWLPLAPGAFERLEIASRGPGGALVTVLELRTAERPRPSPAALPGRPNLVVVVNDALRADSLGVYGHPADVSPRLDAFAAQAVVFEEAWAQSAWTRPAVVTLFTGLTPEAHGVDRGRRALSAAVPTLAQSLKDAGYRTAGFVANDVLSARLGYARGFDVWDLKKIPARDVVAAALAWLDTGPGPFLLYVHTLEPHRPYEPDLEHWKPFLPPGVRRATTKPLASLCPDLSAEQMVLLRSAYLGEVHQNDAAFGALLDGLSSRRLLDGSVVVFTADHGEAFGEHDGCGHSNSLYRELLRVPFIIRVPGVSGRREAFVAQQADLMPTLLALAGAAAPEPLEGRDLSALILRGTPPVSSGVPLVSHLSYGSASKAAARLGRFKLILNRERHLAGPRLELFDVTRDPGELHNIAEREPVATQYLLGQLHSLRQIEQRLKERRQTGKEVVLTPEEEQALRALGYVQ